MSDSFVKIDMKKLLTLNKSLSELDSSYYTDLGVLKGNMYPDTDTSVADVGAAHELGTDKLGRDEGPMLPRRSFLEDPIRSKMNTIIKDTAKGMGPALADGNVVQVMERLGAACDKQIQEAFETGGFGEWPDIAQSTKDNKGSSAILIDTALLRKSISWRVGKK